MRFLRAFTKWSIFPCRGLQFKYYETLQIEELSRKKVVSYGYSTWNISQCDSFKQWGGVTVVLSRHDTWQLKAYTGDGGWEHGVKPHVAFMCIRCALHHILGYWPHRKCVDQAPDLSNAWSICSVHEHMIGEELCAKRNTLCKDG